MDSHNQIEINSRHSPVAIGGLGGSGTRLFAKILYRLGFYLGSDLNYVYDNLWFALLFKRTEILEATNKEFEALVMIFLNGMVEKKAFSDIQEKWIRSLASNERPQYSIEWLQERANSLLMSTQQDIMLSGLWGWKEPNTHVVLDRLQHFLPRMKYIHVVRNGLDMAHSFNQRQLQLWGSIFLETEEFELTPYYSLKYWCKVHRHILDLGKEMGSRFFFLNYDQFCSEPEYGLHELLQFLEVAPSEPQLKFILEMIRLPDSIGRFRKYGLNIFDPVDIRFVESLGFNTNPE